MKKQFIRLLSIAVLFFSIIMACDKTDDPSGVYPDGDGQSAGMVKDADGNMYNTVKIGNQVWMVENLKTTKYNDGTPIPNVTDNNGWVRLNIGAWCYYDNLESNGEIYGRLYNWYAVTTGNLAPEGWHVPTDEDWNILENYLIDNGYNYDGTKKGNKIAKSLCAKTNWDSSEYEGTPGKVPESNNSTGFTALPGGFLNYRDGGFDSIEEFGGWWSSTEYSDSHAYFRLLDYFNMRMERIDHFKGNGLSVRLVKD